MADDQKPKTMDINDLVRELSKSSTSPTTPSPIPPPIPQPPIIFPDPKTAHTSTSDRFTDGSFHTKTTRNAQA